MMKNKLIKYALIIFALVCLVVLAFIPNFSTKIEGGNFWSKTENEITINKTVHDFGIISENGGNVSVTFTITNNTKGSILITHVTASCGCTTPTWTKEPVEPGKTGTVTVAYNPKGRPGPFNKTITITTNGHPERILVNIKGTVEQEKAPNR